MFRKIFCWHSTARERAGFILRRGNLMVVHHSRWTETNATLWKKKNARGNIENRVKTFHYKGSKLNITKTGTKQYICTNMLAWFKRQQSCCSRFSSKLKGWAFSWKLGASDVVSSLSLPFIINITITLVMVTVTMSRLMLQAHYYCPTSWLHNYHYITLVMVMVTVIMTRPIRYCKLTMIAHVICLNQDVE